MENIIFAENLFIYIAITVLVAWVLSQAFKTILKIAITNKKSFTYIVKQFFSDGDFPSSHTAVSITSSIVVTPLLYEAIYNATSQSEIIIAVAAEIVLLLWTAMTIRDALGIRMRVQENAQTLHTVLKNSGEFLNNKYIVTDSLQEFWSELADQINIKAGHLPHEVIGGVILAIIVGIAANSIRTSNFTVLVIDIAAAILYFILSFLLLSKKIDLPKIIKKIRKK